MYPSNDENFNCHHCQDRYRAIDFVAFRPCQNIGAHVLQIPHRLRDILRPKKHPSDAHHGEGPRHAEQFAAGGEPTPFADGVGGVTAVGAAEQERQEERGVDAAPSDERPIGAVPKTAHEEDDEDVADGLPLADARTAERDVEVVAEPRRERDVPAPPKLRDVAREVRRLEVGHELDAKEFGGADGDVAVAGEIP